MPSLKTRLGNIELDNPIILTSGHASHRGDFLLKADRFGAGAVFMKSGLIEREYDKVVEAVGGPVGPGQYPGYRPGFAKAGDGILIGAVGAGPTSIEEWAKWIKEHKNEFRGKIIGSVMAITLEGWAEGCKILEAAGVDGVEIVPPCPAVYFDDRFKHMGLSTAFDPQLTREICKAARAAVKVPLGLKMYALQFDPSMFGVAFEEGFDWLSAIFATPAMMASSIDLEKVDVILPTTIGFYGSMGAKFVGFMSLMEMAEHSDKWAVSANGGVQTWRDIVEFIMYGARSVQIMTTFMRKGFNIIPDMKQCILNYMEEHNFETIAEMRGIIVPKVLTFYETMKTYKETKGEIVVQVDSEKCGCGTPCEDACPIHMDITGYNALVGSGMFGEALNLIVESNPLPSVCGRICPHPCEDVCKRKDIRGGKEAEDAVSIAAIKRFAADYCAEHGIKPSIAVDQQKKEKVAIVGSGPAGLNAAYHLVRKGYQVTIFEALPVAGGMLAVGAPKHRLPREVLQRDIDFITGLGVEIKTNTPLGGDLSLDDIFKQGYQAIFIASGAHQGIKLGIPGEELEGVLEGVSFLRYINLGKQVTVGKKVVVIGGGNVAADVASSVLRLEGTKEVHLICLEKREEMPAFKEEVDLALEEGVVIHNSWGPQRIIGKNGKVSGLEMVACKAVFDKKRRFNPAYIPYESSTLEADTIIVAIGQASDLSFLPGDSQIWTTDRNTIVVNSLTAATSREGVFAGGDVVIGAGLGTAVDAMSAGKRAAVAIDKYIKGECMTAADINPPKERGEIPRAEVMPEGVMRHPMPRRSIEKRRAGFAEVDCGYSQKEAVSEAKRCLRCDCGFCVDTCFYDAVKIVDNKVSIIEDDCEGCGLCVCNCPKEALSLKEGTELVRKLAREHS